MTAGRRTLNAYIFGQWEDYSNTTLLTGRNRELMSRMAHADIYLVTSCLSVFVSFCFYLFFSLPLPSSFTPSFFLSFLISPLYYSLSLFHFSFFSLYCSLSLFRLPLCLRLFLFAPFFVLSLSLIIPLFLPSFSLFQSSFLESSLSFSPYFLLSLSHSSSFIPSFLTSSVYFSLPTPCSPLTPV